MEAAYKAGFDSAIQDEQQVQAVDRYHARKYVEGRVLGYQIIKFVGNRSKLQWLIALSEECSGILYRKVSREEMPPCRDCSLVAVCAITGLSCGPFRRYAGMAKKHDCVYAKVPDVHIFDSEEGVT